MFAALKKALTSGLQHARHAHWNSGQERQQELKVQKICDSHITLSERTEASPVG